MKKARTGTKKVLAFVSIIVLSAILAVWFTTRTTPAQAGDTQSQYAVNESGQTYGSAAHAQSIEAEPDLILVESTNGLEGYVLKTDLYDAMGIATSSEHAAEMMNRKAEKATDAFIASILEQTGIDLGDKNEIVFTYIQLNSGLFGTYSDLPEGVTVSISDFLPDGISEDIVLNALEDARVVNQISIPVYESDGRTIIGEFIIG
ncbi:MAG: hypothetical protein FWD45_02875 [Coriobacteriia bacterium]|nr:hypothetical protein [Coriobacteriia bacterium]